MDCQAVATVKKKGLLYFMYQYSREPIRVQSIGAKCWSPSLTETVSNLEQREKKRIRQNSLTALSAFQLTNVVLGWIQKPAFVYFCVKPKSHFLKDHCRFCNLHCYLCKLHVLCQNRADGCNSLKQNQGGGHISIDTSFYKRKSPK